MDINLKYRRERAWSWAMRNRVIQRLQRGEGTDRIWLGGVGGTLILFWLFLSTAAFWQDYIMVWAVLYGMKNLLVFIVV